MDLKGWQRWTWEEIFSALSREGELGGLFEVPRDQVVHPLSYAAERNPDPMAGYHFTLTSTEGRRLFIREEADRFVAFLGRDVKVGKDLAIREGLLEVGVRRALLEAAAGLFLVLGGLVAWWQALSLG